LVNFEDVTFESNTTTTTINFAALCIIVFLLFSDASEKDQNIVWNLGTNRKRIGQPTEFWVSSWRVQEEKRRLQIESTNQMHHGIDAEKHVVSGIFIKKNLAKIQNWTIFKVNFKFTSCLLFTTIHCSSRFCLKCVTVKALFVSNLYNFHLLILIQLCS
jgi:hypothetical protein